MSEILASAEWKRFSKEYWEVEPFTLEYAPQGERGPLLQFHGYKNCEGRICLPDTGLHKYLHLHFQPSPTNSTIRHERQWLATSQLLVEETCQIGVEGSLVLPPGVSDVRPWQWKGFHVSPQYTYYIDFPYSVASADAAVRKNINKASRAEFTSRETDDLQGVIECLNETEERQGFSYGIEEASLVLARNILGKSCFRIYGCFTPEGEMASARVILYQEGKRAIDWLAGTKSQFMRSGATQHLIAHGLQDLEKMDALGFDFFGANMLSVANSKLIWGGRLVQFFRLTPPRPRNKNNRSGIRTRLRRAWKAIIS